MNDTRETKIEALKIAVLAGDAARIDQLQKELTVIEQNTVANRAAEIRRELERIDKRLAELKEEEAAFAEIKAERNQILFAAEQALMDAQEQVNRINFTITISENERQGLHEDKYAANQQLKWLAEEAAAKFETTKKGN